MANENTVTIPLDEYFDLRQKAEMNSFLMAELGQMRERLYEMDNRLSRCECAIKEGANNGK